MHGTSGSDNQDFNVYAIKLIAAADPAPATVAVTGVTLDKTSAEMTVGSETLTLTATVAPDNATDKTVTWTTSDDDQRHLHA